MRYLLLLLALPAFGQGLTLRNPFYQAVFGSPYVVTFNANTVPGIQYWFKADGTLWQDADRTTAVTADGDPIGCWDDASGYGRNVTNRAASRYPTWHSTGLNSKPYVHFMGGQTNLAYWDGNTTFSTSTSCTNYVFTVSTFIAGLSGGRGFLIAGTNVVAPRQIIYIYPNAGNFWEYEQGDGDCHDASAKTNWCIRGWQLSGTNSWIFTNGVSSIGIVAQNAGNGVMNGCFVGNGSTLNYGNNQYIAEILYYTNYMSSNTTWQVLTYLSKKYNIPCFAPPADP